MKPLLRTGQIKEVVGSIVDRSSIEPLIAEADLVFHLAAVVGVERVCSDPARTLFVNIEGSRIVLELCRRFETKVILASTSEVYGKNSNLPLAEDDETVLGPVTVKRWSYAVSKLADEHLALALKDQLPVVIVRYFNCYGPHVDPAGYGSVVARFVDQALREEPITIYGDGNQTRSFTYVRDTVNGTIAASNSNTGGIFNIGNTTETTINDLAALVLAKTGSSAPIVHQPFPARLGSFEEQRRRQPDITKARQELDFDPATSLVEGLKETISWMRQELREPLRKKAV